MTTRIFHMSDVHFGTEDRAALGVLEAAIASECPDVLVCTGDLTQRATHAQFAAAREWFDAIDVPVVIEPGNHDMPYYNLVERFADPYRRYRALAERIGGQRAFEDVVFVSLKTTVRAQRRFPWSDGVVTRSALRKTVARLEELAGDPRHVVVTAHHPLLGPPGEAANPTIGGAVAFEALSRAGADAILSGHVHLPFDTIRKVNGQAARMIGAGTLSTRLRHGAPASYRAITCTIGQPIESELRTVCEFA